MKHLLFSASALVALTFGAMSTAAMAQDAGAFAVSGNVALTTDYRFRGVSLSGGDFAIQGGLDVSHESGFYAGTWASSIDQFAGSETELDGYVGYGFEAGALAFDVGVIGYFYPGSEDTHYYEVYGSGSGSVGPVGVTVGLAFAPEQDNLADEDNLYVYGDAAIPLGQSPFELTLHVGLEDGAFGDEKVDYGATLATTISGLDVALAFIDTDKDADDGYGDLADETVVFTIGKSM